MGRHLPSIILTSLCALLLALLVPLGANAAGTATATFTKTSDWGSGYEGKYTITNGTTAAISGWKVEVDVPSGTSIGTYWDSLLTKSGQHATFTNRDYNATVAAGASVTFGFVASGSGAPTNCTLNGASCSGGTTPPPGAPGAPGTPTVTTRTDTSLGLSWSASSGTVTGYRVYEGTTVRATVTGTSATISGLGTCTTHSYTVKAYNNVGESPASGSVSGTTTGCTTPPPASKRAAPYLYEGWGSPPNPVTVMNTSGIRWFTMAFILSSGGCNPAWDGSRPLQGGVDAQAISQIRGAGGDVIPSFGGWSGNKLGPNCPDSASLAGAYRKVIDAYGLKSIDIDIENTDEFESEAVQDRVLGALKIIKQNDPSIQTILTFGTTTTGPNYWGNRLIQRAAALQANVDVFTIMPFDFGGGNDMYGNTVNASEGLKNSLKSSFGWSDATAYSHMGISGMNGASDQGEQTTPAIWTQIRDWAKSKGLARLAFWSVNRDQPSFEFTKITAGF